ncbi:hypothetical protein C2W62_09410 [Candidatus Entotheonella serta]|nr:hypothetical protein C2W62_09410 [Candidatus Entotheonella serta]
MVSHVNAMVKLGGELSADEQALFDSAYRKLVSHMRASLRAITSIEQSGSWSQGRHADAIREYRRRIEDGRDAVCQDALHLLHALLLPAAVTGIDMVFYYKM